jgi:hypothetical protein
MSDNETSSPFGRLIYNAQEEMDRARLLYFQERAANSISDETVSYLQASLLRYYSIMRRYRDVDAVEDLWTDEFEQLKEYALSDQSVPTQSAGRGSRQSVTTQPGRVDPKVAVELSHKLDDIATELGFSAAPKEVTPHTEATEDDLAALLSARGQEQALENLPARFRGDGDGDD